MLKLTSFSLKRGTNKRFLFHLWALVIAGMLNASFLQCVFRIHAFFLAFIHVTFPDCTLKMLLRIFLHPQNPEGFPVLSLREWDTGLGLVLLWEVAPGSKWPPAGPSEPTIASCPGFTRHLQKCHSFNGGQRRQASFIPFRLKTIK